MAACAVYRQTTILEFKCVLNKYSVKPEGEPPFIRKPFPHGTPDIGEYGPLTLLPLLFSLTTASDGPPPRDLLRAKTGLLVCETDPEGFLT